MLAKVSSVPMGTSKPPDLEPHQYKSRRPIAGDATNPGPSACNQRSHQEGMLYLLSEGYLPEPASQHHRGVLMHSLKEESGNHQYDHGP